MRVLDRLERLYAIGGGPGANRPHPSEAEDEAHELAARWMREAGLEVESDAGGNLLGRSAADEEVWVGSHLDTVPHGGMFDGALGVVASPPSSPPDVSGCTCESCNTSVASKIDVTVFIC